MGHRNYGTINEVILDRVLTTVLWLLDPSLKISIESLIAVCSRELFVKKGVWEHFYSVLQKIYTEEIMPINDISTLFYQNHIETELIDIEEYEVDLIDREFIELKIEESKEFIEVDKEREVKEKTFEIIACLEQRNEEIEQHKIEIGRHKADHSKQLEKMKTYNEAIISEVNKDALIRSNAWAIILSSLIIFIVINLFFLLRNQGITNLLPTLVPFLFGGVGIYGIFKYQQ